VSAAELSLPQNPVLFGRDATAGIVSVDPRGEDAVVVRRRVGEAIVTEEQPFQPFLWVAEPVYLQGFDRKVEYTELAGQGALRFLARFQSWSDFERARKFLGSAPYFALNDPVPQYLLWSGRTHFKQMRFEQLHRLQIALAGRDAIQLADNRGWQREVHKPAELVAAICERDPDVIEGHDIFRSVLPRLAGRGALRLGRDGSAARVRQSRVQVAERTIQYPRYEIHGRHVVDTFFLAQFYDVSGRELESFDLEEVAGHFGLREEPALAVQKLGELLGGGYFIQAQMFPFSYQDVIVRGNATKIDALLLREYLHRRHSVPELQPPRSFQGGYTDVFCRGVVQNVWHCDVLSLYPSLLLAFQIKPRREELGLFLPLLGELRQLRLEAKRRGEQPLQQTLKILINSFYGYLGFAQAHFGDFDAAAEVARRGRELVKSMLEWLRQRGARVIEVDTDGLYFVPPSGSDPGRLEAELQQLLPKGVEVEIDGQYAAMFSYKMKNYALLDSEGRLHISGSALRSRGLEKFQRQFLQQALRLALTGHGEKVPQLYEEYCERIEQRKFPIEDLAKTETLQEPLEVYRQKIAESARNRSAAYELALKSGRTYRPGDRLSYYVTGQGKRVNVYEHCRLLEEFDPARRDENVEYYLEKLRSLYKKFAPLLVSGQTGRR
jgi:DNA polymerase I